MKELGYLLNVGEIDSASQEPRVGQIVLTPVPTELVPTEQLQSLYRLSDPSLSELGLEELLEQLLLRIRDALAVDTVAILLYDAEAHELVARAAKGIEEEVEQGVRIPIGRGFAGRIAAERVAVFIADVDHADILNPILREKGIQSLLGVPLIVEGELIGVLHVGSLVPRAFNGADVSLLQMAATRVAPGIERARLSTALEHERQVAMILQRSLLPNKLIDVADVRAAARYRPATDEVGGDWYDVFELPRGRVGVAIGDVVGHGVPAAALMGQMRTALHAYAMENHTAARTLELLDRFVLGLPSYTMATAAYTVFDPRTGSLQIASAGHLPPILIGEEDAHVVDVDPAAPLGVAAYGRVPQSELTLAPGETLVLYTDGLIERPHVPLSDSIELLRRTLTNARSPEAACQAAFDALVPVGGIRDDIAVVAIQHHEVPEDLHLRLSAVPRTLAELRRVIRRWLYERGADQAAITDITLAVNEAATNAIEHAYSPATAKFELHATETDGQITVVIRDRGRWSTRTHEWRGRGLPMMRAAMDHVDVESSEQGTTVVMRKDLYR